LKTLACIDLEGFVAFAAWSHERKVAGSKR
jgi:hypothetical protein